MMPLVSVIIPVFNAERHLAETIHSVLAQTWKHIEIILVDDGSTDASLEVAQRFASSKVRVFSQANKGASSARNKGLAEATGGYIQFLDADDLLSPDKIEYQVLALKNYPSKIAVCSTSHFFDRPAESSPSDYEEKFIFNDDDPIHFLVNLWGGYSPTGSMVAIHAWLVPAAVIRSAGQWHEGLSMDDDGEYFCRVILSSQGILKTAGLCFYRRVKESQSLSSRVNLRAYESMLMSNKLKKKYLLSKTNDQAALHAVYKLFMNLAIGSYLLYPQISTLAEKELPLSDINGYRPSMGGRFSNMLSFTFGWKRVKKIQHFINRYLL